MTRLNGHISTFLSRTDLLDLRIEVCACEPFWGVQERDAAIRKRVYPAVDRWVIAALKAAAASYGDDVKAAMRAERLDLARRSRLAAATGLYEAIRQLKGRPIDQKAVAYAMGLELHAVARPRAASAAFHAAADAARDAVLG